MRLVKKAYFLPIVLFLFTFVIYLHNLSKSVFGGDVGDFVTAATVMGVPHPSGYPLITFLGFLLTRIDFITPAFMVGLISVFSSSLAVVIFYFFSLEITKSRLIALLSSLVLAFNYIFWFYAEIAEVFALNNFFVVLLLFLAYLYFKYKKTKYLYFLAFFTGLSMTNNYIISFIFPSLFIFVFIHFKEFIRKPKTLLISILLGLAGLSVYLYIPIASSTDPAINWGNVKDLGSFLDLILRKHYGTFGVGVVADLLPFQRLLIQKEFLSTLLFQLTPPVIFLCIIGAIYALKKHKVLFAAVLIGFILSGPFFIALIGISFYSAFYIGIYERFFTMSSVVILFFLPLGIKCFVDILNSLIGKKNYQTLFICMFFIIPIFLFKYNFPKTDLHNVWVGDNLAYDLLNPLPKNAYFMIIGDTQIFNAWYARYALNVRPDVTLLTGVSNNNFEKVKKEYLKKYPKDAHNPDLAGKVLQYLSKDHPVISSARINLISGEKLTWIPYGLSYLLLGSGKNMPTKEEFIDKQNQIWNNFKNKDFTKGHLSTDSLTISDIPDIYVSALIAQGSFMDSQYKDKNLTLKYYEDAKSIEEKNRKPYLALATYYASIDDCRKVEENVFKALSFYPLDSISYFLLYHNYKFCFKDEGKAKKLAQEYKSIFKGDLLKDFTEYVKNTLK